VYSDESKNRQVKQLWEKVSKGHSMEQQILLRMLWMEALSGALMKKANPARRQKQEEKQMGRIYSHLKFCGQIMDFWPYLVCI